MILENLYKTLIRLNYSSSKADYSNINTQNFTDLSYETINPVFKKDLDIVDYVDKSNTEEAMDMRIKKFCLNNKTNIDALLLLRCRTSHAILSTIKSIWYSQNTNVTFIDLLSIFMEDSGLRYISSNKTKIKKNFINYALIEELNKIFSIKNERIHPFCLHVIQNYETKNNSSIAYWTSFLIKRDPELKKITRPHGQRVLTDWGLLYATSKSKMTRSWKKYGDKSLFLSLGIDDELLIEKIIISIFDNYHFYYPKAKEIYRRINRRDIGWRPDSIFLKRLAPEIQNEILQRKIYFDEKIIEKILIQIALTIRIESGEKLRIDSIEKYNEDVANNSDNKNKFINDFASLNNYLREVSTEKDIEKSNQLTLFIQSLIGKTSYSETKKVFEFSEKNFSSKPQILNAWIEFSKNIEFNSISINTKIDKSTLSKTFKCQAIASKTADEIIENFRKFTFFNSNNIEDLVNEFNTNYQMSNIFNMELALILSNAFKIKSAPSKTIFDDEERYDLVFNTIMRYVNPKKGPKVIISNHVNKLLDSKGYL